MQYYKVLCVMFSTGMIFFYSFTLETPWQKRKKITKQLIVTHNIQEQEKYLLEAIIEAYPEWVRIKPAYAKIIQETDFSIYTPEYCKDLIQLRKMYKKTSDTQNEETLKNQIILYITYVAINKQWLTIENKLKHLNNCFQQYTLSYLQETWERYQPTMVISTIPTEIEELPYEKGTVEEVPSEEEKEITILESSTPHISTSQTTQKSYYEPKKHKPSEKKPDSQSNIFTRFINSTWNGIANSLRNIYNGITWIINKINIFTT